MHTIDPFEEYAKLKTHIVWMHTENPDKPYCVKTVAPKCIHKNFNDFIQLSCDIKTVELEFLLCNTSNVKAECILNRTCFLDEIGELGERWARKTGRHPTFVYPVFDTFNTRKTANNEISILKYNFDPAVWHAIVTVNRRLNESNIDAITRYNQETDGFFEKVSSAGYASGWRPVYITK